MLAVLSPAKSLDLTPTDRALDFTQPALLDETLTLMGTTRNLSPGDLKGLMRISDKLAELNHERFQSFATPFTRTNAKPAALMFAGDTYAGLKAPELDDDALRWAQDHLGILSGLYGLVRPLDLIQPYRLEMGTRLATERGDNLYAFWGDRIAERINALTAGHADRTLVNLASNEYFKAVRQDVLAGGALTMSFKEIKDGSARVIGLVAKRARGMMARWMVEQRVDRRDGLKDFAVDDYAFQPGLSSDHEWVFTRPWRTAAGFV
ncbi:MAG: peroxide stress protein YaaA [Deltaproteobacteria bacterium]|nr:MAG: peroxide stress protein YaaA [Deltaproteobacteria bacterium]